MSTLKKQIRSVEADINLNNAIIHQQSNLLKNRIASKQILYFSIVGCFFFGYCFARKRNLKQMTNSVIASSLKMRRWYKKIEMFLPFFIL